MRLFFDIETAGDRLLMVSHAIDNQLVRVSFPTGRSGSEGYARWLAFLVDLEDPHVTKVCQSDYDLWWFKRHGYEVDGPFENTMVMAWVHDENQPLDLASLSARYGAGTVKEKSISQRDHEPVFEGKYALAEYDEWPQDVRTRFIGYSRTDTVALRDVHRGLMETLEGSEWLRYWREEEVPYSKVVLDMECRGLPINLEDNEKLRAEVQDLADAAEEKLRRLAQLPPEFNLNSPDQLRLYLFNKWFQLSAEVRLTEEQKAELKAVPKEQRHDYALSSGFGLPNEFELVSLGRDIAHGHYILRGRDLAPTPPPKKKGKESESTQPSTQSKELLYKHGKDPWVRLLCLEYRRTTKLLGTYLEKFPRIAVAEGEETTGKGAPQPESNPSPRIYGRFKQTGTVTGRLSSFDPNLQNIPSRTDLGHRVRELFQGRFVIGDYDALEMRLMAHFSQDPKLLEVFREGLDPHAVTAEAVFGYRPEKGDPKRDMGKELNYAIGYGAGARTLAQTMSLRGWPTTQSTAKDYQESVQAFYPRLFRWKDNVIWNARQTGGVNTIGGRRRRIGGGAATWLEMAYGERQAANALVQGTAADIVRRVMVHVDREYPELKLLAQVHDELIWEYDEVPSPSLLEALQVDCQAAHGYDLTVPLVMVPHVCESWGDK